MQQFLEFVDHKVREGKKHLGLVKKLLESEGYKVRDHLEAERPYLFIRSPDQNMTIGGIRLYKIASELAFRVQMQEATEPFGKAYSLNLDEMFQDYMTQFKKPETAGKEVIKAVGKEIKKFFDHTKNAEKELRAMMLDKPDPLSKILVKASGTDYSNQVFSKGF